jgi:hypothetical protein
MWDLTGKKIRVSGRRRRQRREGLEGRLGAAVDRRSRRLEQGGAPRQRGSGAGYGRREAGCSGWRWWWGIDGKHTGGRGHEQVLKVKDKKVEDEGKQEYSVTDAESVKQEDLDKRTQGTTSVAVVFRT